MSPVLRILAYCSIAIWPVTVLRFIHRQVPNFPYWDEWDEVPTFVALHNGTLTLGDLWATHNEHRVFFARLLMIMLDRLGGWDLVREMNLSVVLATVSVILLTMLVRKTGARHAWPFAGFLISAVSFSFAQSENWSWGGTISTFMVNIGVIGAVYVLSRDHVRRRRHLPIAIACGFFASYSLGLGLMIWVAGLAVLLCAPRFDGCGIAWWCVAALAAFYLYLHGMPEISGHSLLGEVRGHPGESARYLLTYLGSPLGRWLNLPAAIAIGAIEAALFAGLAGLAIVNAKRDPRRLLRSSAWIGLGVFVIANAFVTVAGRLELGVTQAESSRYTTTSMLLVLAIIGLTAVRLRYVRPAPLHLAPALAMGAAVFALNLGCSNAAHLETIGSLTMRKIAVAAVARDDSGENQLIATYLYPDPAVLRVDLATLQELGQARAFAL